MIVVIKFECSICCLQAKTKKYTDSRKIKNPNIFTKNYQYRFHLYHSFYVMEVQSLYCLSPLWPVLLSQSPVYVDRLGQ